MIIFGDLRFKAIDSAGKKAFLLFLFIFFRGGGCWIFVVSFRSTPTQSQFITATNADSARKNPLTHRMSKWGRPLRPIVRSPKIEEGRGAQGYFGAHRSVENQHHQQVMNSVPFLIYMVYTRPACNPMLSSLNKPKDKYGFGCRLEWYIEGKSGRTSHKIVPPLTFPAFGHS